MREDVFDLESAIAAQARLVADAEQARKACFERGPRDEAEWARLNTAVLVAKAKLEGMQEAAEWIRKGGTNDAEQVEAAGGGGFREGTTTRGCPHGFGDLPRMGDGVTFGVFSDLRSVMRICSGTGTGCGQMPGSIGFVYVGNNWWAASTIVHEIGHMAGLGHSGGHDIMAPQAAEGQRIGAAYVRAVTGMSRRGNAYLPPGRIVQ